MKRIHINSYFDRVVLINLKRRHDRLLKARRELRLSRWPFRDPEIFEAVDGYVNQPPAAWRNGPGAWGCLKSHQVVLEKAIKDGVDRILILEDDVCFMSNFRYEVEMFLRNVPDDWDQLMIGGQHYSSHGKPTLVKPGVLRCTGCERRHCYAVRGEFMRKLCKRWSGGGKFNGNTFGDKIMARDPDMQLAHKVYAPRFFLAGQERSYSDIFGAVVPRRFWNPPGERMFVINLRTPSTVTDALQGYGFCTGRGIGKDGSCDIELAKIFDETRHHRTARLHRLRNWIKLMQWELASDRFLFCTISHPDASPELVKEASLWKVYDIEAASVGSALAQLPKKIRNIVQLAHRRLKDYA